MRVSHLAAIALASSMQLGCYAPAFRDCELQCGPNDSCPDGQMCVGVMCRDRGTSGECSLAPPDAPEIDAGAQRWSAPVALAGIPLGFHDPSLRGDMKEMFLSQNTEVYHSVLGMDGMTWGAPTIVSEIMQVGPYTSPFLSFDGLQLYVVRISGTGAGDISRCTRLSVTAQFTGLLPVTTLNSPGSDSGGSTTADKQLLALTSDRGGPSVDVFETTFDMAGTPQVWHVPRLMTELNSAASDNHAVYDATGLRVVFASNRAGNFDLYTAKRARTADPFDPPEPIVDVNTMALEQDPWLSPDGKTLVFTRGGGAATQMMMSTLLP